MVFLATYIIHAGRPNCGSESDFLFSLEKKVTFHNVGSGDDMILLICKLGVHIG